eukprot:3725269-Pyramimonas_sp.AAC.1
MCVSRGSPGTPAAHCGETQLPPASPRAQCWGTLAYPGSVMGYPGSVLGYPCYPGSVLGYPGNFLLCVMRALTWSERDIMRSVMSESFFAMLRFISRMFSSTCSRYAWVYSHDGLIRRRKREYVLMTDQSDAGSA